VAMLTPSLTSAEAPPTRAAWLKLSLSRLLGITGIIGVLTILVATVWVGYDQWRRLTVSTASATESAAFFLAEHAARLFEVSDLALQKAIALADERDWDEIGASRETWDALRGVREDLTYVEDLWLNDATGRLRLTSFAFPTPESNVADRSAFTAHLQPNDALFVSPLIVGRVTGRPTFLVSRRMVNPDGSLKGVALATLSLEYFLEFWKQMPLPPGATVTLFRGEDMAVLSQHPPAATAGDAAYDGQLAERLAAEPSGGTYVATLSDGSLRQGAFARVKDLPVYLRVSVPREALREQWLKEAWPYILFAAAALLSLVGLTAFSWHQARREEESRQALEAEILFRTRALREETHALEVVNRANRRLSENLDVDAVVQTVVDAGTALTGAEFGAVFYNSVDETGESLMLYALSGAPREAFSGMGHPRKTAVFAPTFEGTGIVRSDDITADPRYGLNAPHKGMPEGHLPVKSYLAVPVVSRSATVHGGLFFGHPEPGRFSERHERMMVGLAAHAAIAIDNARLFEAAQAEIAARAETEAQQQLLIRELNHRVKNTLATVKALVTLSARSASSVEAFSEAFSNRIAALAHTHTLLTEAVRQTVTLKDLISAELGPYADASGRRVRLEGPPVTLGSEEAVPLGMAFHELVTNAVKYGALSVPGGVLTMTWNVLADGDVPMLRFSWEESGGPPVSPPNRRGFGSTLLEKVLAAQLKAEVGMNYDPAGLRFSACFPLRSAAAKGLAA